jgi:hypothetical protein
VNTLLYLKQYRDSFHWMANLFISWPVWSTQRTSSKKLIVNLVYNKQLQVSDTNSDNQNIGNSCQAERFEFMNLLQCIWHEIFYFLKWKNSLSRSETYLSVSLFVLFVPEIFQFVWYVNECEYMSANLWRGLVAS